MANETNCKEMWFDILPNQPCDDQTRTLFKQYLVSDFEGRLPASIERFWKLPPFAIMKPSGIYGDLLVEARQLFVAGYFYSCVAMSGIVGERIIKDTFRASILVKKDDRAQSPNSTAFDQFEHVDVSSIARFLNQANILSDGAAKAAKDLGELRNKYSHARGDNPEADAVKAIKLLHTLIDDTVSVFKNYEIKDGVLVRKTVNLSHIPHFNFLNRVFFLLSIPRI